MRTLLEKLELKQLKPGSKSSSLTSERMRALLSEQPYQCVISQVYDPKLALFGVDKWMVISRVGSVDRGKLVWHDTKGKAFERVAEWLQSSIGEVFLELVALDGRTITHGHREWSLQIGLLTKQCALNAMAPPPRPVRRRCSRHSREEPHTSFPKKHGKLPLRHIDSNPLWSKPAASSAHCGCLPIFSLPKYTPKEQTAEETSHSTESEMEKSAESLSRVEVVVESPRCFSSPEHEHRSWMDRQQSEGIWRARQSVQRDTPYLMAGEGEEPAEAGEFTLDPQLEETVDIVHKLEPSITRIATICGLDKFTYS